MELNQSKEITRYSRFLQNCCSCFQIGRYIINKYSPSFTFQDFSALIHLKFFLFQFKVHVFTKFEKGSYVVWIWELLFYLQLSHLSNIHLQYDLKWSFMFVSYVFFTVDYNNTRVSLDIYVHSGKRNRLLRAPDLVGGTF
jgi:hypothetical protein